MTLHQTDGEHFSALAASFNISLEVERVVGLSLVFCPKRSFKELDDSPILERYVASIPSLVCIDSR